jgi:hypothetical protein
VREKRVQERDGVKMPSSSGATTRAQKRRIGQRDLWDVIVNNDDVCFKHILPRLNQTDVKFLFEVNSETRALIKRSSRKDELKKRFEIEEMPSISTLEFAWENRSLWPRSMDEKYFCWKIAYANKLELLKWAREEKKCDWGEGTIGVAAEQGNLEMLKYCVAKRCPMDADACAWAAYSGNLEILKYLREEARAPWDCVTAAEAAGKGHLHILEYLVEQKYVSFNDFIICYWAALEGHLDCLKYLHEVAKAPWDWLAVHVAHDNQPECLQYLLDNDCPLPPGWRYEHGTLHTD